MDSHSRFLIAYEQLPLTSAHTDVCDNASGLNFSLSLNLYTYFVYVSGEVCIALVFAARQCNKNQNLVHNEMMLLI